MSLIRAIVGPRVPPEQLRAHGARYAMPTLALSLARVLMLVSIFLPWWHMTLEAPQYPEGLELTAYVNHLDGDVAEIDGLNHYIGMRKLDDAAAFERANGVWMVIAMVLLVEGAMFVHSKWAVLLVLPAVLFPAGFIADLQFWLHSHGQNLNPKAPLSSSVKPFTPPALGVGTIGQFKTIAEVGIGWWMALGCSILTIVGLFFHRRAYKPLVDAARAGERVAAANSALSSTGSTGA